MKADDVTLIPAITEDGHHRGYNILPRSKMPEWTEAGIMAGVATISGLLSEEGLPREQVNEGLRALIATVEVAPALLADLIGVKHTPAPDTAALIEGARVPFEE
jgi:hypothetical protein